MNTQPRLMSVAVDTRGEEILVGTPEPVLDWPYFTGLTRRTYDVGADGRFLAINDVNTDTAAVIVNTNFSAILDETVREE